MTIEKDVEHPVRGRFEKYENVFWVKATSGDRIAHFAATQEMLDDRPMMEHMAGEAIKEPAEKDAERNAGYLAAKAYFANVNPEEFGKTIDTVIERMKQKGAL